MSKISLRCAKAENGLRQGSVASRTRVVGWALAPFLLAAPCAHAQVASAMSANAAQYLTLGVSAAPAFQDSSSGSALAQITRAQNGGAGPSPAADPAASAALAASPTLTPAAAPLQTAALVTPASYSWSFGPAQLEPAIARAPLNLQAPVGPDPSIFGSVALRVSHLALDPRWVRVANAQQPSDARWRGVVRAASALPDHARVQLANSWINRQITFEYDITNYGVRDYWASARESLARGRGDCEDYAIAKMELLRAAGIPADDLYLVVAKDLVRRVDHAILVVRLSDGFWVLDNGTDEVLPAEAVQDYRPVVTFSAGREWMHGFRRAPELMLASAARLAPASGR